MKIRSVTLAVSTVAAIMLTSTLYIGSEYLPHSNARQSPARLSPKTATAISSTPRHGLNETYNSLMGEALSGNTAAASRLLGNLATCQAERDLAARMHESGYGKWVEAHSAWLASRSAYDQVEIRARAMKKYRFIDDNKSFCAQVDDSFNDGRIYDAAILAARGGDASATACLLDAPWKTRSMTDTEALSFDQERFALADRDLARGKWVVVAALKNISSSTGSATKIAGRDHNDRYDFLRFAYLERLGWRQANDKDAFNDQEIALAENDLDEADQAKARAWAQTAYDASFRSSGVPLPGRDESCTAIPAYQ